MLLASDEIGVDLDWLLHCSNCRPRQKFERRCRLKVGVTTFTEAGRPEGSSIESRPAYDDHLRTSAKSPRALTVGSRRIHDRSDLARPKWAHRDVAITRPCAGKRGEDRSNGGHRTGHQTGDGAKGSGISVAARWIPLPESHAGTPRTCTADNHAERGAIVSANSKQL